MEEHLFSAVEHLSVLLRLSFKLFKLETLSWVFAIKLVNKLDKLSFKKKIKCIFYKEKIKAEKQ